MTTNRRRGGLGWADGLALLTLLLLCFGFLWQIALAGRIMAGPDAFSYFYPMYEYASARLLAGQLPLWNPHLFMGAPFLANPQTGVFYPLHWPLLWLPAPTMATVTLFVHYSLMLLFMYLFLRSGLRYRVPASMAGAMILGLSGLAGSQAEHINQIETLAWLPLQALILEKAFFSHRSGRARGVGRLGLWLCLAALVSCVQLLAGHAQAAYVCNVTLAAYAAARAFTGDGERWARAAQALRGLVFIASAALLGAAMAGVQLLPTLELTRLSVRGAGLPYRQAVSFSFAPKAWLLGLLPHFAGEEVFSEYSAYTGLTGLLLAGCAIAGRDRRRWLGLSLTLLGLSLALGGYNPAYYVLYRLVPGMALFRAPARWLVAASFGLALLAADGLASLRRSAVRVSWVRTHWVVVVLGLAALAALWALSQPKPSVVTFAGWLATAGLFACVTAAASRRVRAAGVLVLLAAELLLASRSLPYNDATAPSAYYASRRAPQVLTRPAENRTADSPGDGLYRFLSVSAGRFDAGDMADLAALNSSLAAERRYALLVTSKWQEVMARNLALHAGTYGVDGYDGGVLPTRDFVALQTLFLPPGRTAPDGRLSEALTAENRTAGFPSGVPPDRLLALAGVRYLIRDRVDDVWVDGVYYDLGLPLSLAPNKPEATVALPAFPTTTVGLICSLRGKSYSGFSAAPDASSGPGNREVGLIEIGGAEPATFRVVVTASGIAVAGTDGGMRQAGPVEGHPDLYHLRLPLRHAGYPESLHIRSLTQSAVITVSGVSLVNDDAGTSVPVSLAARGAQEAIHYGDVKVYQFDGALPRAYFRACYDAVVSPDQALAAMGAEGWDARKDSVLIGADPSRCRGNSQQGTVVVASYEPEQVRLAVEAPTDGYVILADSYYPGWVATVDGGPTAIVRANYLFRAVHVSAGNHDVEFMYRPRSLHSGAVVSGLAFGLVGAVACASYLLPNRVRLPGRTGRDQQR